MPAKTATEERDEHYMREALRLAHPMLGRTAPNPAVGCVIVRDGKIVGSGATAAGGRPHAETQALLRAGSRARGATAVVSFEPCAHQGQTPPCARALIDAGVARVVIGCGDPYPQVRGRGIAMLKRAGTAVTTGVLEDDCRRLNEGFITRVTRGRPFTTLKLAMTLDGRIAAAGGDSRWISSVESREVVHRWRNESDIVMVGAGTVLADNPRLTCRIEGGRDPIRLVVDSQLRCEPRATIFRQRSNAPTMIATTPENCDTGRRRYGRRVEVIASPRGANGIDLDRLVRDLAARGWSKILIEGGAHLGGAALEAGIVDRVAFFIAPRILGGGLSAVAGLAARTMRSAITLDQLSARAVGPDWLVEATVVARRRSRS
ncbi:MAG TPA: bifunctional diaminohydroxyphosphoribosylaminopyrimidine deaminase/5-amino-6-(5-phosphoribosylamino)uracil reductase RibD, partial [Candidatus Binataceae bacterium]|nr:bifunctional diaminohydroxyphosphoribosylaminopyrimidine deaminase/5-amino-6-(5-phosphoribosylamino)uracil reductase RibD [Candidatus Binataceae bacterium]